MHLIVLGNVGSDAGYWVFGPGGWHHVGGWGVEALADVTTGLAILGEASHLKTPGLSDSVSKGVFEFVQKELTNHLGDQLKQGAVVVVNASAR